MPPTSRFTTSSPSVRTCRTCGTEKPLDTGFRKVNGYPLLQCRSCYAKRDHALRSNPQLRGRTISGRHENDESLALVMDRFALLDGKVVHRRTSRHVRAGKEAGHMRHGYRIICIGGATFMAHRVGYALKHGRWPAPGKHLDHVHHEKERTEPSALRIATVSENNANVYRARPGSESGLLGVSREGRGWTATVTVGYQKRCVGRFASKSEAGIAVARAKVRMQNVPVSTAAKIALIAIGKNPDSASPAEIQDAVAMLQEGAST